MCCCNRYLSLFIKVLHVYIVMVLYSNQIEGVCGGMEYPFNFYKYFSFPLHIYLILWFSIGKFERLQLYIHQRSPSISFPIRAIVINAFINEILIDFSNLQNFEISEFVNFADFALVNLKFSDESRNCDSILTTYFSIYD